MRVVIAEDLFLLRDGLTRLLSAHGLDVIAAVGTAADLLPAPKKPPNRIRSSGTGLCRSEATDSAAPPARAMLTSAATWASRRARPRS